MNIFKRTPQAVSQLVNANNGRPFDLLIRNVTIVDVIAGELRKANVAVQGEFIVYVGDEEGEAKHSLDGTGKFLAPGFMDAHIHTESSMLSLPEFARAVLPHGTTAVFADPHEIANVLGRRGVELFLNASENLPFRVFIQVPSRVPTARGLEGTGGQLTVEDTKRLLDHANAASLGEIPVSLLMDPAKNPDLFEKIAAAHLRQKPINGHAPATGRELASFLSSGINDDHTCINLEDGIAKVRSGMWIMIKESSLDKNIRELYPLLQQYPHRCNLCCDDVDPLDLVRQGHMDHRVRMAIDLGVNPVSAFAAVTFTTAQRHHLEEYIGSITPGKVADFVILTDLKRVAVEQVWVGGKLAVDGEKLLVSSQPWDLPEWALNTVHLPPMSAEMFVTKSHRKATVRVINLIPGGGARNRGTEEVLEVQDGYLQCKDDINFLTTINRYGSGEYASAFVRGFNIKGGALASSIAHDHHNLLIAGDNPNSMLRAAEAIEDVRGGVVVVQGEQVAAIVRLSIAGLMAEEPLEEVAQRLEECNRAAADLGCKLESPFMSLSFVGLPSMPEYGLTDRGLVDVARNAIVPVIVA
jgi:adenine deaminase